MYEAVTREIPQADSRVWRKPARERRLRAAQDGRQRLTDGREGGLTAGLAAVRDQR